MAENYGDYKNKSEVQFPKEIPPAESPDIQEFKAIDSTIGKLKKSISNDFAIRHEPIVQASAIVGDPVAAKAREVAKRSIILLIPEQAHDLEAEVIKIARPRFAKLSIVDDLSRPKNVKNKVTLFEKEIKMQSEAKLRDSIFDAFPEIPSKTDQGRSASSPEKA